MAGQPVSDQILDQTTFMSFWEGRFKGSCIRNKTYSLVSFDSICLFGKDVLGDTA